jgi:hypothetical protein
MDDEKRSEIVVKFPVKIDRVNKRRAVEIKRRMIDKVVNGNELLVFSEDMTVFACYLASIGIDPSGYDKPYIFHHVPDRVEYFKWYFDNNPGGKDLAKISPELCFGMEIIRDDKGLCSVLQYFENSLYNAVSCLADRILQFIFKNDGH